MSLVLLSKRMETPFVFSFWQLKIPTKFASMRKWARVRKTCTRAYTREVRSPSLAKCGGWGKEIRKFWSAFENIQTIVKYDFLNIFKHLKVFVLNLENFKLVCFLQIWKKMETIRKKKKNVILRCELYACYELLTSWIQSLFQTIQLGYYQTTKKKKEMFKNKTGCLGTFCTNRERTVA